MSVDDNNEHLSKSIARQIRVAVAHLFNVRDDQAGYSEIDSNIRNMVEIKGTNLWVLMFAIIIASIGLNVNSTAVIIGAMLISPLMGPIMGIGYGVGINDFELIQKAFKSLSLAVLISLMSATLYFLISPLSEARSELLARTTPTLWDVLIALFGGLAGILAMTRKEKSNVIPGVAIATALMPPLCTAGYGLATGHLSYFFGAFYLFFINTVFIALATVLFVGYIKPPHRRFVDAALEKRVRNYIVALVLVTVLPSIYLAYNMVTDVAFNSRAHDFIKSELAFDNTIVTQTKISPDTRQIEVTLLGNEIAKERLTAIEGRLKDYKLENAKLVVHQTGLKATDISSLKTSLLSEFYSTSLKSGEEKDKRIQALEDELAQIKADQLDSQSIARELGAQYPMVTRTAFTKTTVWKADGAKAENTLVAYLVVSNRLSSVDRRRIKAWLKIRTKMESVILIVVLSRANDLPDQAG